jgi:hypothetical protein
MCSSLDSSLTLSPPETKFDPYSWIREHPRQ